MKDIFSFFQGVFTFFKSITKNMHKKCAVIASGAMVIAVVCFNSTCYGGSGKNNVIVAYANTGEDKLTQDEDIDELLTEENGLADSVSEIAFEGQLPSLITNISSTVPSKDMFSCVSESEIEADVEYVEVVRVGASPEAAMPIIEITQEDYENLVRIVEAEATDLDVKAKILVANVVINRVFSEAFPDTVTEVIYQGDGEQFRPIKDGRFYSVELTESSYEAVDRALMGEDYSEGALFFASTASAHENSWFATSLNRLFEYNGHVFFTFWE